QPFAVEPYVHAGGGVPDPFQRRVVAAVVVDDAAPREHVAPEHAFQFRVAVRAVRAGGDQDGDVAAGDAGELLEDGPQHLRARLRPRDVADRDGELLPWRDQRAERRAVDR